MFARLIIILACLLAGCSGGRNAAPAGEDYPVLNGHSTLRVTITSDVPPELDVSFRALWVADGKIPGCMYYENAYLRFEGAPFPYSATLPLAAERRDGRVVVPIVLDQYMPGRCNWQLSTIQMLVTDRKAEPQKMDIYYASHRASSSSSADVWCRPARRAGEADEKIFCSFHDAAMQSKVVSPSSLALGRDVPTAHMRLHYVR